MKIKKRNRRKLMKATLVVVSVVLLYGEPFTGFSALEPERIRTRNGTVVAW
jgi:hypothetical protein